MVESGLKLQLIVYIVKYIVKPFKLKSFTTLSNTVTRIHLAFAIFENGKRTPSVFSSLIALFIT